MLNYSPEVSFLTSQRTIHGATLQITENDYAKWSLQDNAILWVGDISATGTTISHVLKTTLKRYREKQLRPGWLVFVTIGTLDSLRGILCAFDAGELDFEGMSIVFLEGVFTLYKGSAALDRIHLPYTDLIRKNAPCAPEFERESLKTVQAFLERCVVYDGGSRAFEPLAYARGIKKYWASLAGLDGWTLEAVLDIHCNVLDYRKPYEEWAAGPFGGDQESLYDLGRSVLQGAMESDLCSICVRRLKTLRDAFGRIGLRLS